MELTVVPIVKPDATNFIFGQSHFIKTVEDLHEALVGAVPGIRFGLAFCEASGKRLVRWSGNDEAALALARDNASSHAPPPPQSPASSKVSIRRRACKVFPAGVTA